jgi:hypothetical protein
VAPRRIDIITKIDDVDFAEAYAHRRDIPVEGCTIPFISREHLIRNKRATGRDQDKLDAEFLDGESGR